ncbi:MAG: hypothetical protein KDH17_02270 [Rhodocyclaceae bacterium]|nr:hypothetical protein [Rhodocyclaceae bacterium]
MILTRLIQDETGAAASEYAIMVAIIALAIATAASLMDLRAAYSAVVGIVASFVQ